MATDSGGTLKYDKTRKLKNDSFGEKFLIMKRIGSSDHFNNVSTFLLDAAIKTAAGGEVEKCVKMKDGSILIKTKSVTQAKGLVRLIEIQPSIQVMVEENEKLNNSKGVVYCEELKNSSDLEILNNMKKQHVVAIKRFNKKVNGVEIETGLYMFTFCTNVLPESVKIGFLNVKVRPYIPAPLRCYNCFKFGHISSNCKISKKCINCGLDHHVSEGERCTRLTKCVNCQGDHVNNSKNCPFYKKESEIQKIKVTENVHIKEAVQRYKERNPIFPSDRLYSSVLRKCNCKCSCESGTVENNSMSNNQSTEQSLDFCSDPEMRAIDNMTLDNIREARGRLKSKKSDPDTTAIDDLILANISEVRGRSKSKKRELETSKTNGNENTSKNTQKNTTKKPRTGRGGSNRTSSSEMEN